MANARAQLAAQRSLVSSASNSPPSSKHGATPDGRGTKRPADAPVCDLDPAQKRPQHFSTGPLAEGISRKLGPIDFWAREGHWPREYFELDMEHILERQSLLAPRRRSSSATSITPSDQRPREEKSAPYRDPCYEIILGTKGSFMTKSNLDITNANKALCRTLLENSQPTPEDSLFRDDIFQATCDMIHNRNEARVIRDITRLIVPSAESLATFGAKHLDHLVESVNEGWNSAIPLVGARPQPDYSVGFRREAFNDGQLAKLSPFVGDFMARDLSFFMATYYLYFPFLTCEVQRGAGALNVADRQNAHSMTLAVRAVVELFRVVKREGEVHRQILAFSVSHDDESVRIYGHYAVIDGEDTKYYRHPIRKYTFAEPEGKEKWTAYRFTRNLYDVWMPMHFQRICSAIDQLPSDLNLEALSGRATGLS
ncbi:uncharacterized protein C8A04DRAFT_37384 [Dichotomopilus funicola]|uniref:DUF7924 domain-containing protein n=1 Tax=Dichotomopilus funicola TaxID=1934379 RepID=A0AAN6V2F3_9PEZI|nr:hypothetical protein C8A04DRAFT_37384 [Dichotomopilus funicola]